MKTWKCAPGEPGATIAVTVRVYDTESCRTLFTSVLDGCVMFRHPSNSHRRVSLWDGQEPVDVELDYQRGTRKRDRNRGTAYPRMTLAEYERRGLGSVKTVPIAG